jgi:hypothetical protein
MVAVVAELGVNAPPHGFGRKDLLKRKAPPYVCWIPADSEFAGADIAGGNPRKLWVESQLVEVHCWATDEEMLRAIRNNELVALQRLASTSMTPRRSMPVAEAQEWLARGAVAVLTISITWPIRDELVNTTTFDGWTYYSDSTPGDGWIEHGEP